MAFDFPASPTNGQTIDLGGTRYQWNGYAWVQQSGSIGPVGPTGPEGPQGPIGPAGPSGGASILVGDSPPSSPSSNTMWWESDTGYLWLWYDDGNSQQWVQINSPQSMPPADGNEYVMRNGLWRLKSQRLDFTNVAYATGQSCAVPTGAKAVKFTGQIWSASATAWNAGLRCSIDGTTYLSGAADYAVSGAYFQTATAAWSNQNTGTYSFGLIGLNAVAANLPSMFEGHMTVGRVGTGGVFTASIRAGNFQGSTHYVSMHNIWTNGASWSGATQLKGISFGGFTYTGTFSEGFVDLEWVY